MLLDVRCLLHIAQLFLLTFSTALAYQNYFCGRNGENVVATVTEATFFSLSSYGFPSSTSRSCQFQVKATRNFTLYARYIYAYYSGEAAHSSGSSNRTIDRIDTRKNPPLEPYFHFDLGPNTSFISIFETPRNDKWNGFQLLFIITETDVLCPLVTGEATVLDEPVMLFRGSSTRSREQVHCQWNLTVPSDDERIVVTITELSIGNNYKLSIFDGGYNDNNAAMWKRQNSAVKIGTLYYNSTVAVDFMQEQYDPMDEEFPFVIFVNSVPKAEKTCSLPFHGMTNKNCSGRYSNVQILARYPPNQHCEWKVVVPPQTSMTVRVYINDALRLTGDHLQAMDDLRIIEFSDPEDKLEYVFDGYNARDKEVTFIWDTDGLFEFIGFDFGYYITGCERSGCELVNSMTLRSLAVLIACFVINLNA